ncbi:MAG: translocation/assembly module TamB domain-containing protein [candidate division WOR-3 bacterium]
MIKVPLRGEVEFVSLNSVKLKDISIGNGIRAKEIYIHYYLDKLLLYRTVDYINVYGGYVDIPSVIEDFAKEKGEEKARKKPNLPFLSLEMVEFEDFTLKSSENLEIWAFGGKFLFGMGGNRIELKRISLNAVDIPPLVFIDSANADLSFDFDTLKLFSQKIMGYIDTMRFSTDGFSLSYPIQGDTPNIFMYIKSGTLSIMGTKNAKINWKFLNNLGDMSFETDSVWYSDIFVKYAKGNIDLKSYPEIFVSASGEIFNGKFETSVFVDSSINILGSTFAYNISPIPNVRITGKADFEVYKSRIRVKGYVSDFYNSEPEFTLNDVYFSVESPDFIKYSYKVFNNFINISGWYNLKGEDFYARFSLRKPTRIVSFGNLRVFTFEGDGEVVKMGRELDLYIGKVNGWYAIIDSFRIDEFSLQNFRIKTDFYSPNIKNTFLKGYFTANTLHPETLKISGNIDYDSGDVKGYINFQTAKFGDGRVYITGYISDTNNLKITFDSLYYSYKNLDIKVYGISYSLDTSVMKVFVPQNNLLNGSLQGELSLNRKTDTLSGFLKGNNISISRIIPIFFPEADFYLDTINVDLVFSGTTDDPVVSGNIRTSSVVFQNIFLDSTDLNAIISKDKITLEKSKIWAGENPLFVEILKVFFDNRVIYGHIYTNGWNTDNILNFLMPESSYVNANIWLAGTIDNPDIMGQAFWTAKSVEINGNPISRPKIHMIFDSKKIILAPRNDTNVIYLGGGSVEIGGNISTNGNIDSLVLNLRNAYINLDNETSARLSGNLLVSGNIYSQIFVRGEIFSHEFYFEKPLSELAAPPQQKSQKPIILYDIHFSAPRRLFINSPIYSQAFSSVVMEIDAEVSADITLQKVSPVSALNYGYLEIIRGNVYVLDKVFNIDKGYIELYGNDGNINISSSTTILKPINDTILGNSYDSVNVFVNITGSISKPKVDVWSQPYMSTGEIITLILARQGGLVSALIGTGLRKGLRIQEFSIKNTGDISQLIFGTYVGRNLYIRYSSNKVGQSNYNSLKTQYFIRNNLSVYGERLEDEGENKYGVGVSVRIRF